MKSNIHKEKICIGLMSGTSLDGVDCAMASFAKNGKTQLLEKVYLPYSNELKEKLKSVIGLKDSQEIKALNYQLGILYAEAIRQILDKSKVNPNQIYGIGCHGQTITHQPFGSNPFTLQLGDPEPIKTAFSIPVIHDFRSLDVARGGQGAPLAPLFHNWFFKDQSPCVVVNIGGIANLSLVTPHQSVVGWDTGPGNVLLDQHILQKRHLAYDHNGSWGIQGQPNYALLEDLLSDAYFKKSPPKSTGTDYFNLKWVAQYLTHVTDEDLQATLTALTAMTIANEIKLHLQQGAVYVCGGGAHNAFLMSLLQNFLTDRYQVLSTQNLGIEPDWIEAVCFAWLALKRLENIQFDLKAITGNPIPTCLGQIA